MTVQIIKNFISPDYASEIIKNSENLLREAPRSGYFETHHRYVPAPFEEQDFSLEDYETRD